MGTFVEMESGYYKTQNIAEIEGFEPDQYNNHWYNVKFEDSSETYMWLAKNKPEEGKEYYGHLEPTKSGKRLRFKTDKVPDDAPQTPQNAHTNATGQSTDESIARAVALKAAVEAFAAVAKPIEHIPRKKILEVADTFLAWLQNTGTSVEGSSTAPPTSNEEKSHPASESKREWTKLHQDKPDEQWQDRDIPPEYADMDESDV